MNMSYKKRKIYHNTPTSQDPSDSRDTPNQTSGQVSVPFDFGLENLRSRVHGNITINLQGGTSMFASSLILSYNSTVFKHMFFNMEMVSVDIDDFTVGAVRLFIEALYTGRPDISRKHFRDLNKMAHVFKVSWLVSRCRDFFCGLVGDIIIMDGADFEGLMFLFEEASFFSKALKSAEYMDIFVKRISNAPGKLVTFVKRYANLDYFNLSKEQLNAIIKISSAHLEVLIKIMISNIKSQGMRLDDNSKYLLQNIDLRSALQQSKSAFDELFDFLLEKVEAVSVEDMRMLIRLNREATKESTPTISNSQDLASNTLPQYLIDVPNVLHIRRGVIDAIGTRIRLSIRIRYTDTTATVVRVLSEFTDQVKNLYMVFEMLEKQNAWDNFTKNTISKLNPLRKAKGWDRMHPDFIDGLYNLRNHPQTKAMIKRSSGLISKSHCEVMTSCTRFAGPEFVINRRRLVERTTDYKFYFEYDFDHNYKIDYATVNATDYYSQINTTGFILRVTPPIKPEDPPKFKVQLLTDPEEYSLDKSLRYREHLVAVENMHVVVYESTSEGPYDNMLVSWNARPVFYEGTDYWVWGMFDKYQIDDMDINSNVVVRVYYSHVKQMSKSNQSQSSSKPVSLI